MDRLVHIKQILLTLAVGAVLIFTVSDTQSIIGGAGKGIALCLESVLPSLLPFMFISCFIAYSGIAEFTGSLTGRSVPIIFGVPKQCASVILMSFLGGYPVGIKMASALQDEGKISDKTARHLNLFCMNAGPGFVIATIGGSFYRSKKVGLILYLSSVLACLTVAFILRFIYKKDKSDEENGSLYVMNRLSEAFIKSSTAAGRNVINICFLIILFSAFEYLFLSKCDTLLLNIVSCLPEVTTAVRINFTKLSLPIIAAVIGFGGFCVHIQVLPELIKTKTKLWQFELSRVLNALFSYLFCKAILVFFPVELGTLAQNGNLVLSSYSVSLPASCSLMISCAILILELDSRKKVW